MVYKGSLLRASSVGLLFALVNPFVFGASAWVPAIRRRLEDLYESQVGPHARISVLYGRRFQSIILAVIGACALAGYLVEVLLVGVVPAAIGQILIGVIFGWMPHHPHVGRGRYTNTRVTLYPGSGPIAMGHDRHAIHHMLPSVQHYRLGRVFEQLRPVLEARGTRIEGSRAGSDTAAIFLGSDPERICKIGQAAERADALPFPLT